MTEFAFNNFRTTIFLLTLTNKGDTYLKQIISATNYDKGGIRSVITDEVTLTIRNNTIHASKFIALGSGLILQSWHQTEVDKPIWFPHVDFDWCKSQTAHIPHLTYSGIPLLLPSAIQHIICCGWKNNILRFLCMNLYNGTKDNSLRPDRIVCITSHKNNKIVSVILCNLLNF